MFTDEPRRIVWNQLCQRDLQTFGKLLTGQTLLDAATRAGVALGRGPLCLANLAWLSIACALHSGKSFAEVLVLTLKLLRDADDHLHGLVVQPCVAKARGKKGRKKHDPRPADAASLSEEAFSQARQNAPLAYWVALIFLLGEKFHAAHGSMLGYGPYRLLAIDGTTINLPNWGRLKEHFGTAGNGKNKARQTQARLVMATFPQARIPWKYELCPLSRSEKTCARSLLEGLASNDLVLMDKGFWSYGLFCQIAAQKAFFAIRLFKGVRPKTLRRLGKNDRLARWSPSDRKWKNLPRHIDLRVIRYQVKGFRPTALVTNLTDLQITAKRWVQLADDNPTLCGLYHCRWQIETTFSELKVHQKMEGQLRGRTPRAIAYEVAGHILLYLLTRWLMVEAAREAGVDPLRLSHCRALRELQDIAPLLLIVDTHRATHVLIPRLLKRVASHQVPWRPGRHYPRPNDTKVKNKGRGCYKHPTKLAAGKA
jgi:hypothetical protein